MAVFSVSRRELDGRGGELYSEPSVSCFLNEKTENSVVERIWTEENPTIKGDLIRAISTHLKLESLLVIYRIDKVSREALRGVISDEAKKCFPELASVEGLVPFSTINIRLQMTRNLAQKFSQSLTVLRGLNKNLSFGGRRQISGFGKPNPSVTFVSPQTGRTTPSSHQDDKLSHSEELTEIN